MKYEVYAAKMYRKLLLSFSLIEESLWKNTVRASFVCQNVLYAKCSMCNLVYNAKCKISLCNRSSIVVKDNNHR